MIEYQMRAVCDKCGVEIQPWENVKKSEIDVHRWQWQRAWAKAGVMAGLRPRYRQAKLYCGNCAGK